MGDGRLFPAEMIAAAIFAILIYVAFFASYQLDTHTF
jgi:hypothetical protein